MVLNYVAPSMTDRALWPGDVAHPWRDVRDLHARAGMFFLCYHWVANPRSIFCGPLVTGRCPVECEDRGDAG